MPKPITIHQYAVRFIGESQDRIGGYLVRFTGPDERDLWDEYFTAETDLGVGRWSTMPLLYQHGFDDIFRTNIAGLIDTLRIDDTGLYIEAILADALRTVAPGLWSEAQVERYEDYMAELRWLIEQGYLGWSSGALPQSVQVDEDGKILRWHVIEGSLTPTPAEPKTLGDVTFRRAPGVREVGGGWVHDLNPEVTAHAYRTIKLPEPEWLEVADANESAAAKEQAGQGDTVSQETQTRPETIEIQEAEMPKPIENTPATPVPAAQVDMEALRGMFTQLMAERQAEQEQAELEAKAARVDELEETLAAMQEQIEGLTTERQQPARRLPGSETPPATEGPVVRRVEVGSRYDHLSAIDMVHGYVFMKLAGNGPVQASEQFHKALADKVLRDPNMRFPNQYIGMKDDELVHSTQTGYGDEWVPDLWSAELWREARLNNVILPLFRVVEMPSNPYELPVEGADPTVYYVPETTNESQLTLGSGNPIPDSKLATAKVTLTAKKLALRVGFSSEVVEDSIIPVLPELREQSLRSMANAVDYVLLNGDTTDNYPTAENISYLGADPPNTSKFLAFNGLRHLPLVTTTANAVNGGGVPTLALLRQARFTMAGKYSVNPANLAIIVDAATYAKLLSLDEVITIDKFGSGATVLNGQLAAVDGMPVMVSAEAGLTYTDGFIHSTPASNTKGQVTIPYRPGWVVGYRRRVAAAVEYISYYDAYQMTATMRLAFVRRDTDVAACLYNLTV